MLVLTGHPKWAGTFSLLFLPDFVVIVRGGYSTDGGSSVLLGKGVPG